MDLRNLIYIKSEIMTGKKPSFIENFFPNFEENGKGLDLVFLELKIYASRIFKCEVSNERY